MNFTPIAKIKSLITSFGPRRLLLIVVASACALLLLSSARAATNRFITSALDALRDKAVSALKADSRGHEKKADAIRDERLQVEGEIKAGAEEAERAARVSADTLNTLTESKRRHEQSKKMGRRTDAGIDDRERDVLSADRELYPDADR